MENNMWAFYFFVYRVCHLKKEYHNRTVNLSETSSLLSCSCSATLLAYSTLQLNPVFYSNLSSCLQLSGLQSFSGLYSLPKDTLPSNLHFLSPFHLTSIFYLLSLVLRGLYTWCTVNLFRYYSYHHANLQTSSKCHLIWNMVEKLFIVPLADFCVQCARFSVRVSQLLSFC